MNDNNEPSWTLKSEGDQAILDSLITCPHCGAAKRERMPTDACWYFYDCTGCGARLKPKRGDCCVFCSYGSVPCPPAQAVTAEYKCVCCTTSDHEGSYE